MNLNESEFHILEATLSPLVIDSRDQVRYDSLPYVSYIAEII